MQLIEPTLTQVLEGLGVVTTSGRYKVSVFSAEAGANAFAPSPLPTYTQDVDKITEMSCLPRIRVSRLVQFIQISNQTCQTHSHGHLWSP